MEKKRKIKMEVKKVSFAEAEELDLEYYAGLNWKESVTVAEEMRKMCWDKEYKQGRVKTVVIGKLKEDRDELE
jgi:hypothetical protein